MAKAGEALKNVPGVETVTAISGNGMMAGNRSNAGMAVITLKPWDERTTTELQWYNIMRQLDGELAAMPEAESYVFPFPTIHGLGHSGGMSASLLDYGVYQIGEV